MMSSTTSPASSDESDNKKMQSQEATCASAKSSSTMVDETLSPSEEEVSEEMMDEKARKKHQNSIRWKRWWLKNREAYNEKRRVSSQVRSSKTRTSSTKKDSRSTEQVQPTKKAKLAAPSIRTDALPMVAPCPMTRTKSGEFYTPLAAVSPSISPAHTYRAIMDPVTATSGFFMTTPLMSPATQFPIAHGSLLTPIAAHAALLKPLHFSSWLETRPSTSMPSQYFKIAPTLSNAMPTLSSSYLATSMPPLPLVGHRQ